LEVPEITKSGLIWERTSVRPSLNNSWSSTIETYTGFDINT